MQEITKKKRGAMACAAVFAVLALGYVGILLTAVLGELMGDVIGILFLLLYGSVIAACIVGVFRALHQRLKELDSGEEEEAKKY